MTDGIYIDVTHPPGQFCSTPTEQAAPILDLSTFDAWIAIQMVEVSIDLLYRIAADLAANKGWPGIGYEVSCAADGLKTLTRHVAR